MLIHSKKNACFLLIIATFSTILPIISTFYFSGHTSASKFEQALEPSDDELVSELSSSLLRFRALANSDSPYDLQQKNFLCSKLISLLSADLSKAKDKGSAAALIAESIPFLNAYCSYILSYEANVSCSIGQHLFPYKTYGSFCFPGGMYDTLLVTIGEGRGSNWWCLAFPPLCFADESFVDVPASSFEVLHEVLSDTAFEKISAAKKEKNQITSGIFLFLKNLFG